MNLRVWLISVLRRGNLMKIFRENMRMQYAGDETSIASEMRDNAIEQGYGTGYVAKSLDAS